MTWLFLVGVALIILGMAMFVLVDGPRRLLVFHGYPSQRRSKGHQATTLWYQETAQTPSQLWHGTVPSGLWQQSAGPTRQERT